MEGAFVSPKNHKTKEKKTMKTKRLLAAVLVIALAFCACTIVLASKPQAPTATVTIISEGRFVVKNLEVVVSGEDFNLDDDLKAAHDAAYEGGAGKGYASATGEYGLYITKLWGDESGAFGYAVNNKMSGGLGDKVKAGDSVVAYIYTDKTNFSDRYTYFNVNHASAKAGEKLTLTLSSVGYDEKFNAVSSPLAGATITVDGEKTEYKTDAEGNVTLSLKGGKTYTVSAVADSAIVPPLCVVTVAKSAPSAALYIAIAVILVCGVAAVIIVGAKKKNN